MKGKFLLKKKYLKRTFLKYKGFEQVLTQNFHQNDKNRIGEGSF